MKQLIIILANVRSAQNVGAIMRTADAVAAQAVWCVGVTPYPISTPDSRPPYIADRAQALIAKTALSAELTVPSRHFDDLIEAVKEAKSAGFTVAALEQDDRSVNLFDYKSPDQVALIIGPEVDGLTFAELELCDHILEIPMHGTKESLNASVAAGIAMYALRN